jgi:hypothetical protein
MRKILIIGGLLATLMPSLASAQFYTHRHASHYLKKLPASPSNPVSGAIRGDTATAVDTSWVIQATPAYGGTVANPKSDTSRVYETYPNMSLQIFRAAATDDSTALKIIALTATTSEYYANRIPPLSDFSRHDSLTVTGRSSSWWVLTDGSPAYPNAPFIYFIVEGAGDNDISAGTTARFKFVSWDPNDR